MERITIIVTLFVCTVLVLSYIILDKKAKKQKEEINLKNILVKNFYKQEINRIKKLELAGLGNEMGNNEISEFEFTQAVKEIKMPNDTKIQLFIKRKKE